MFVDGEKSFDEFIYFGILGLFFFIMWYIPPVRSLYSHIKQYGFTIFSDKLFLLYFLLMLFFPLFLLVVGYMSIIKYRVYRKIITDEQGITFIGLFKTTHINWNEIASLAIDKTFFTHFARNTIGRIKIAVLDTKRGKYYFPLSMKIQGKEYPTWYRGKLIDQDWKRIKEIAPENCQLFVEIKTYLEKA